MRLQELYIKDYKVLQDFTLTFNEESAISVLIGENGSGKTTIIECLTLIFAELFKQSTVSGIFEQTSFQFEFRLRYRLYRHSSFDKSFSREFGNGFFDVELICEDYELTQVRVFSDDSVYGTPELISQFLQEEGISLRPVRYLFPANVVLYYSGISAVIEKIVDDYQNRMILGSLDGEMTTKPDLFYFKSENFPALLIGLLSFRYGNIPEQLESNFRIDKVDSFNRISIRIRRPKWAKSRTQPETFWGAKGELANFLALLRDRTNVEFGTDSVTFNIFSPHQLDNVWGFYGTEKSLFEYLVTLQANDLVDRIDVDLRKDQDLIVPYDRLSEGEKQLLIIIALRELLVADENSLFLFDEPDTFLHATWQIKFIEELQADLDQAIQYIITTHSPLLLNHAKADISKIRVSQMVNGKLNDYHPRYAGRDIATVLYELMGVEERPSELRYQLTQLFSLIEDERITDARRLLSQIAATVGTDDPEIIKAQVEIDLLERLNATDNEE